MRKVIIVILFIVCVVYVLNFTSLSSVFDNSVVVDNQQALVTESKPTEKTEGDKLEDIKNRPEVQKKIDSLVKEIYLSEIREEKEKELKEAEAALEKHRSEEVSFQ